MRKKVLEQKKQQSRARHLLIFTKKQCENQQVISGCYEDKEKCELCSIWKAANSAQYLLDGLKRAL